jgi:hypothetical protein
VDKAITAVAALAALLALAPSAAAASPPLFGTAEFRSESLDALPKWQRALRQIEREQATYRACARASEACPSARRRVASASQKPDRSPVD